MPYISVGGIDVTQVTPALSTWYTGQSRLLFPFKILEILGFADANGVVRVEVSWDNITWYTWLTEPILPGDFKEIKCNNHSFPYSRLSAMVTGAATTLVASLYGSQYRT